MASTFRFLLSSPRSPLKAAAPRPMPPLPVRPAEPRQAKVVPTQRKETSRVAAEKPYIAAKLGCITSQKGTLAFFERFSNRPEVAYAVTCSHNLAPKYSSKDDKPRSNPADSCSVYLPFSSVDDEHVVGHLVWAKTLIPHTPFDYDC